MLAVAFVTRNRVISPHYPDTYCEVIKEGPMRESLEKLEKIQTYLMIREFSFQNETDVSLVGTVTVKLILFPHKIKIFMN